MTSLSIRPYALPFQRPFVTGFGVTTERKGYLLRVDEADAGGDEVGYGDVAPLPGFGGESLDRAREAIDTIGAMLAGLERLPHSPRDLRTWEEQLVEALPDAPCARSGVVLALADRAARVAGLPLAHWLDPDAKRRIAVNATIGALDPDEAASAAARLVGEGYRCLKVKLGLDDELDLERIRAVRRSVGRQVALRLDANAAWDEERAATMLARLRPLAIEYVEQPVGHGPNLGLSVHGLRRIRLLASVPIAADELLLEPGAGEAVIAQGAADLLILKPSLLGGPLAAQRLALRAREQRIDSVVTTALDSAVGRLGALHLAGALRLDRACGLATGTLLAKDVAAFPEIRRGHIEIPDAPGLGVEVGGDWKAV